MNYIGVITGTSFVTPTECITNNELVVSYNKFIKNNINDNGKDSFSNSDFIYQASGIKQRFVHDKAGILDINRMRPKVDKRDDELLSLQAEFALEASVQAILKANIQSDEIDGVIVACSNFQRPYPGIAVELQNALNAKNAFSFDMNVGCASAVFGIGMANSLVKSGLAKKILIVTPELYTFHMNFKDRRSHFIFGDGCSAVIVENVDSVNSNGGFLIKSTKLHSTFSNNIRNNFGFINFSEDDSSMSDDKLFIQDGKRVRNDVINLVTSHIQEHMISEDISVESLKKLWMHQANIHINNTISKNIYTNIVNIGTRAPTTLDKYANTAASGVIGCFNENNNDMEFGDQGMICAFGSGYNVGSLVVERINL